MSTSTSSHRECRYLLHLAVLTLVLALFVALAASRVGAESRYVTNEGCIPSGLAQLFLPGIMYLQSPYFDGPWEVEPNNSAEQANGYLVSGRHYFGYPNDRNDLYAINVGTGGQISVRLEQHTGSGVQLSLFYQNLENLVVYDYDLPFRVEHIGPPGLYYVFVFAEGGYSLDTPYDLIVTYPESRTLSTPLATSSQRLLSFRSASDWMGYRFEDGTQGWGTSEGEYKLAELSTSTEFSCTGEQSLLLTTQIANTGAHILRFTEATAYFSNAIPEGATGPGPYDLEGETFSCYVYFPDYWADDGRAIDVQIFAKDKDYRNQWGQDVVVTPTLTEEWFQLELVIDAEEAEAGFLVHEVNTLGIRIDVLNDEPVDITGEVYIDECTIGDS